MQQVEGGVETRCIIHDSRAACLKVLESQILEYFHFNNFRAVWNTLPRGSASENPAPGFSKFVPASS